MKLIESTSVDPREVAALRKLVAQGEGLHLEFKKKAAFPDKLVKELIAFANTEGGVMLVGVDDDGTLAGVKYPEEEIHVISQALSQHCRPLLEVGFSVVPVSPKKFVVQIGVPISPRRPHRMVNPGLPPETFVRVKDSSVKASRELVEIIRRKKSDKDVKFAYGPHESTLIKYLEQHGHISVQQFSRIARISRHLAARKLIRLVLAHVLKVTPAQPDLYSRL